MANILDNTTSLQNLLDKVNNLPDADIILPELQNKTVNPSTSQQVVEADDGYDGLNKVTVNAIPNTYIIPSGTLSISTNGTHNVKNYASVNVNVAGGTGENTDMEDMLISGNFTTYENNRVENIRKHVFAHCSSLTSVSFPVCTSICDYAFNSCISLRSISFPVCTNIGSSAFYNCSNLTSVSFPSCTNIGDYAFCNCSKLSSISFPSCTNIGDHAFYKCSNLTSISFPSCTNIGSDAFGGACRSLTSISFPVCKRIGNHAFVNCGLKIANFPACTHIGDFGLNGCSNLTSISFPVCTSIGSCAFVKCSNLTSVSFPSCTNIGSNAFLSCYNLSLLTLGASKVCTLSNSNAFSSTPYAGYKSLFSGTPYIYVPSSLVETYKSATNWAYFSSYFSAIGRNIITFYIDGTEYQAEEGMTWYEWCDSKYNTNFWTCYGGVTGNDNLQQSGSTSAVINESDVIQYGKDTIQPNAIYDTKFMGNSGEYE